MFRTITSNRQKRRRKKLLGVMKEIRRVHGEKTFNFWYWNMTPMPCWMPSREQIMEGALIASASKGQLPLLMNVLCAHHQALDKEVMAHTETNDDGSFV